MRRHLRLAMDEVKEEKLVSVEGDLDFASGSLEESQEPHVLYLSM
jgi:hypothetical protein